MTALAALGLTAPSPAAAWPWDPNVHYWGFTDCQSIFPPVPATGVDVTGAAHGPVKMDLPGLKYDVTFMNIPAWPNNGPRVTFTVYCGINGGALTYRVVHTVDRAVLADVRYDIHNGGS